MFLIPQQQLEYQDFLPKVHPELFNFYSLPDGRKKRPGVRTITYQITDDCNMACTYCYQHHKCHHVMPFEIAKKFTDWLLDENNPIINPQDCPGVIIEFIGGEPFLQINLIDKICNYFLQQTIQKNHPWAIYHRFSICSNGLLYFEPEVQNFIQKHIQTLAFSISIDGNKELHDMCRKDLDGQPTYDRAITAVEHYMDTYHVIPGSKMTLSPDNITFTSTALKDLILHGFNEINVNCVYEEGWQNKHGVILYQELKNLADWLIETDRYKTQYIAMFNAEGFHPMPENDNQNWCGGVDDLMLSVDYKGDIYPCIRYMESSLNDNQPPIIIGNVEHGLYQTKEELAWQKELYSVDRRIQSTDECWNCPIAQGCGWCSAYNYEKFGTVKKRATFICPTHKATSLANVYYWNLVFIKENDPRRFKMYLSDEEARKFISDKEIQLLHTLENFPHIETEDMKTLLKDV